jgi:superfamily I DNA/RNA helicase
VFLHPSQRELVERQYNGPVRVSGSAGTGKTVVGLHRAVHLARRDDNKRILLATFSRTLAEALQRKLPCLIAADDQLRRQIAITDLEDQATQLYQDIIGKPVQLASAGQIENFITEAGDKLGEPRFPQRFLLSEWRFVVDAWQLRQWEDYRDVSRLGRRMRIGGQQREWLWKLFETVQQMLADNDLKTTAEVFAILSSRFATGENKPFDHIVVDEAQDLGVPELRFLATLTKDTPDALFFCGDLGQRIFQQPFSWKALGIDIRGRSHTLKVNYRTSHQIRSTADRLLPKNLQDADGIDESRTGTVSVFDGPEPLIRTFSSQDEENRFVAGWLNRTIAEGIVPAEIGICVRSEHLIGRAVQAAGLAGIAAFNRERESRQEAAISIGTMHSAKGLEFKAVVVMACDDDQLPLQERIESAGDENELDEIFETERQLLYVACTRARDKLLLTGVEPYSEFIDDLLVSGD